MRIDVVYEELLRQSYFILAASNISDKANELYYKYVHIFPLIWTSGKGVAIRS